MRGEESRTKTRSRTIPSPRKLGIQVKNMNREGTRERKKIRQKRTPKKGKRALGSSISHDMTATTKAPRGNAKHNRGQTTGRRSLGEGICFLLYVKRLPIRRPAKTGGVPRTQSGPPFPSKRLPQKHWNTTWKKAN